MGRWHTGCVFTLSARQNLLSYECWTDPIPRPRLALSNVNASFARLILFARALFSRDILAPVVRSQSRELTKLLTSWCSSAY